MCSEDSRSTTERPTARSRPARLACLHAQGEVDVVLDLVANVEDGQHLAVANVPPPRNTLPGLTAQRALLVQAKQVQLRVRHPRTPQVLQAACCLVPHGS